MLYEIFAKYWHKRLFLPPRLTLETNVDESSFRFNYIFVQRSAHTLFCNKKKKKKSSLRQERAKKKKKRRKRNARFYQEIYISFEKSKTTFPEIKKKKIQQTLLERESFQFDKLELFRLSA